MSLDFPAKIIGMDWSKRPGFSESEVNLNDFCGQPGLDLSSFIVVHGAGLCVDLTLVVLICILKNSHEVTTNKECR